MAKNSRNLDIEVSISGEDKYKQSIAELNAANKTMGAELKRLAAEYQGNTDSMDYLTKRGEALQTMLTRQREKVDELKQAVALSAKLHGEASVKTQSLAAQLANAQTSEINLSRAVEENSAAMQGNSTAIGNEQKSLTGLGDILDGMTSKFGIQIPDSAKTALNGMVSFSTGTVAALGAAAAGITALYEGIKALHNMTIEYAAQADELITKSAESGLSTEFLQAYEYASQLVDVPIDTFADSMKKLTDKMADARDGNEKLQETFKTLGVSITDVSDGSLLPAEQVVMDVIDALHDMGNETERNAIASDLFGESYQNLNPLIVSGTKTLQGYMDAAKDNYVLTNKQIEALGALDDQVQLNNNQWEALKKQIAAQFAPASKEALENFGKLVGAAGNALIDSKIIEGVGEIFKFLSAMMEPLTDLLSAADTVPDRLNPVYTILHAIAGMIAWIADAANAAIGVIETLSIVGAKDGLQRFSTAMGFGAKYGNYSNLQKWQGYGDMTGNYYDESTGLYTGNYGRNAGGTQSWRGGLTWVGESGPELVSLPAGSEIYNAQDSKNMMGTVYIGSVVIDAKNVKEFNDIVRMARTAAVEQMMG